MAAHPLVVIVAGLSCLGVGAAVVTAVADGEGAQVLTQEEIEEAPFLTIEERYKALDAWRLDCATGKASACFELGGAYETREDLWGHPVKGEGLKRDDAKSVRYFRLACDLDHKPACRNLGRMYETGKGVSKNSAEAARFYHKACELRDAGGCRSLRASADAPSGPGLTP